ncbi:MAG TPA: hypothetical protein VMH86_06745 [Rhizomicrobium sp.]|nr:hypothetical protein [Rhizomicrobium sp.]
MNTGDTVSLSEILSDPCWFPAGLERNIFDFVFTDHETLASQPFLDRRWNKTGLAHIGVPADELLARAPAQLPPTPLNFIWHTGFCCSTLLARLLDKPGRNLSLSEPQALTALADARRAGALPNWNTVMRACQVTLHLIGRPLEEGAAVTVKPTPSTSCFLREAAELTGGRMLFLHSDCESFVASVHKLGEEGRAYVARMVSALTFDRLRPPQAIQFKGVDAAALVWHMQMAAYRVCADVIGARAASLDCDAFLDRPGESLSRIDAFLGLKLGGDHIAGVLEGPLFRRNVKDPSRAFDAVRRREEHAAARKELGAALEDAVAKSRALFPDLTLPNPLAGAP